ncbi:UNVERIFIED_CONTAM: hypothetical protein HDU68_003988, partial [Siphonaria sp. JEL0065]
MLNLLSLLCLLSIPVLASAIAPNDHANYNYYAIKLVDDPILTTRDPLVLHSRAQSIADHLDMHFIGQIGELKGYYQVALAKDEVKRRGRRRRRQDIHQPFISDQESLRHELNQLPTVAWSELMTPRVLSRRGSQPSIEQIAKTFAISDPEF